MLAINVYFKFHQEQQDMINVNTPSI